MKNSGITSALSDFIIISSTKKPKTRAILTRSEKGFYFYSINCLKMSHLDKNYVICPLMDIHQSLTTKDFEEEINDFIPEPSTYFYLGYG